MMIADGYNWFATSFRPAKLHFRGQPMLTNRE
jgi:hypothetical protein